MLNRLITKHRPCLWLWGALSMGIGMGSLNPLLCWPAVVFFIVFLLYRRTLMMVMMMGVLMACFRMPPSMPEGEVNQWPVSIVSDVYYPVSQKFYQQAMLATPVGRVSLRFYGFTPLSYGDQLKVTGQIKSFYHQRFLSVYGNRHLEVIAHQPHPVFNKILQLRRHLKARLQASLPEDISPLVVALVLGDRSGLSKETIEQYKAAGVMHVLAISGMNMSVVMVVIIFCLRFWVYYQRVYLALALVILWVYALMTGLEASVWRAALMLTVVVGGQLLRQEADILNSVGLAGIIMLIIDPMIFNDIGYQFSFAAVIGILWLTPIIMNRYQHWLPMILTPLAASFGAWIMTAPIQWWHFQTVTLNGIIANIVMVPLADLIVLGGIVFLTFGSYITVLGDSLAGCLTLLVIIARMVVAHIAQWPIGHWQF